MALSQKQLKQKYDTFITAQINSFGGKKFTKNNIIEFYKNSNNRHKFLLIEIKNGQCIPHSKLDKNNLEERTTLIYHLLFETVKRHTIKNTVVLIHIADGYFSQKNPIPVFNWAIPDGIPGLIFPHFDTYHFSTDLIQNKVNIINNSRDGTIDELKKTFYRYPKKRIPIQDVYFKGGPNTKHSNQIRELLEQDKTTPINVDLDKTRPETIYELKNHKYLLDLPGYKPHSIRLKYLFFAERTIIRVSFHNSAYGEKSYWKQYIDAFIQENIDYVHLIYDFDYYLPLTKKYIDQIKSDIKNTFKTFENKPHLRQKINKNGYEIGKNITFDNALLYLKMLLDSYTENVIVD